MPNRQRGVPTRMREDEKLLRAQDREVDHAARENVCMKTGGRCEQIDERSGCFLRVIRHLMHFESKREGEGGGGGAGAHGRNV
jgi:hypothetical protein